MWSLSINWKCFRERLSRLEGQQKLGGHKTGHLQSLLHQHMESRPLYNILPPIHGALPPLTPTSTSQSELLPSSSQPDLSSSPQPLTPASQLDIESKVGSHLYSVNVIFNRLCRSCVWWISSLCHYSGVVMTTKYQSCKTWHIVTTVLL